MTGAAAPNRRTRTWVGAAALLAAAAPCIAAGSAIEAALAIVPGAPARLELSYWPEGGWRVRQTGRQIELAFPGMALSVATGAIAMPAASGAIEAIGTETRPDATYLRLSLGCDCTIAVQGDGARLFIDILGTPPAGQPVGRDDIPAPQQAPVPPARPGASTPEAVPATASRDAATIEATRSRLLSELRRAADAGLVTLEHGSGEPEQAGLSVGPPPGAGAASGEATDVAHAGQGAADPAPVAPPAGAVAENAATAVAGQSDDPLAGADAALPSPRLLAAPPAGVCLGNGDFLFADPMPHAELAAEIGRLRRRLVGEFDQPEPAEALALAGLYLAHGMGIEAERIVSEFAPALPRSQLIVALGRLVEGEALPHPNILAVPGCKGQHALWQAVDAALAGRPKEAVQHAVRASGALEQMPRGLRGAVAARLGLAAARVGRRDLAERMHAMARRSIGPADRMAGEDRLLLEAMLDRARGDDRRALARVGAIRAARGSAGEEALLMLAELSRGDAGGADALRLDLGALALGVRGTGLGARALVAEAEVTGRLFGRDAAFDLLEHGRASGQIGPDELRVALAGLARDLPDRAGDVPLAVLHDADPDRFAASLDDRGFRLAVARSYLQIPAPALAEALLRAGDLADARLATDLAQAYLATGETDRAAIVAGNLAGGPDRDAVAAAIALADGDPREALDALRRAAAPAALRARAAWAAGDWRRSADALAEAARQGTEAGIPPDPGTDESDRGGLPGRLQQAVRLAFAAHLAGDTAPPAKVARLVASSDVVRSGIAAMFAAPVGAAGPAAADVGAFMAPFEAEARMIEELLRGG